MKISIYGKQMTVRESLKVLVEKKLAKFDKFFGEDAEAFVTCKSRKGTKIIEITINYNGTIFRSEDEGETFMTALDRAVEGLERQIRKNKTKINSGYINSKSGCANSRFFRFFVLFRAIKRPTRAVPGTLCHSAAYLLQINTRSNTYSLQRKYTAKNQIGQQQVDPQFSES